jgi:flagellar motor protein MotB
MPTHRPIASHIRPTPTASARRPSRAARTGLIALLVATAGLGVGCVSQQKYDDLFEANRTLRSRNVELQSQIDDATRTTGSLRGEAGGARSAADDLSRTNATLRQQLANAEGTIAGLEDRLNNLEMVALPADTDASLRNLASNSDVLTYDPAQGMVRMASDLTFGLGSAELTAEAKQSLRSLAAVLNGRSVQTAAIRVVGHTDSIAISSRIRDRFPSNMHLSVARSLAVRAELDRLGVASNRMEAAGWGPYRPQVPNNPNGITAENRRVEIFIVPGGSSSMGSGSSGAAAPTHSAQPVDRSDPTFVPMK